MTGVGDGIGRVEELQNEFEDERMGEEVEIDEDELDISHHQITAIVGGFGVTDYHCSRCGLGTSRLREVQTTPCEPEDETDGQLVADGGAPQFEPGDRAVDRDEEPDRQTPVVVVEQHDTTAREHHVEAVGASVYLLNQAYPPDASVVDVVYESSLDDALPVWREAELSGPVLRQIVDDHDLTTYSFPAPRLQLEDALEAEA